MNNEILCFMLERERERSVFVNFVVFLIGAMIFCAQLQPHGVIEYFSFWLFTCISIETSMLWHSKDLVWYF